MFFHERRWIESESIKRKIDIDENIFFLNKISLWTFLSVI
jgi:hypothetical protein